MNDSELTRALMANDTAALTRLGCTVGGAAPESDKPNRKSKYGAVKTVVDGITFASKKEAAKYEVLKTMEAAGLIRDLELQPKFELHDARGNLICTYLADFRYKEEAGTIVLDVKGFKTPIYRLKKKWTESEHKVKIVEI